MALDTSRKKKKNRLANALRPFYTLALDGCWIFFFFMRKFHMLSEILYISMKFFIFIFLFSRSAGWFYWE